MFNIIYGPAGCGKTKYIYDKILQDLNSGKKVALILPDQFVYSAENTFAELKEGISSFDFEIFGFRRLANFVFRQVGGISFSDINESGKLLIMWRVLLESIPFLKAYGNVEKNSAAFSELMLSTVNELKQFMITPSMLEMASKKLSNDHAELKNKLEDISFLYGTFQSFLSNEYNDPTDELTRLLDTLKNNSVFDGYNVYIDAFDGFTTQQYSVIEEIATQCSNITVSLCFDKDDVSGVFSAPEKTYENIKKCAERLSLQLSEECLSHPSDAVSDDILFVSKNFWNHNIKKGDYKGSSSNVKTLCCNNKFEECEAVSADILKKVRNGARFEDIVVIARDITSYDGIIDTEFENNGIPFHMSRKTDIASKPIFKLILAAFAIKNKGWQYSDVISFLKTGLVGVSYNEIDVLENYASTWNINGKRWTDGIDWHMNPDGFVEKITSSGANVINTANEVRNKIVPHLSKFFESVGNVTVKETTTALYQFLTDLEVKQKIEKKAAYCHVHQQYAEEKELVQLWNILVESLDTIVELAGDMVLDGDDFVTVLSMILGKTDIGTIPSCMDQVILGSASSLRTSSVPHVYLLGVNEGEFPMVAKEGSIFNDAEKSILKSLDLNFVSTNEETSSDELYWFYKSISRAEQSLTLTYTESDLLGNSKNISVAGSRIHYLLGYDVLNYSDIPDIDKVESKNIALKIYAQNKNNELGAVLRKELSKYQGFDERIETFDTPLVSNEENIDSNVAKKLYTGDIDTTQTKIDSYVTCSFNYHCKHILNLAEKKRSVFRGNDIGNFVHVLLERFVSRITTDEGMDTDLSDDEIDTIIKQLVEDYVLTVCQGAIDQSARMSQLIKRLKKTVRVFVKNLLDEFKTSDFVPMFFELPVWKGKEDGIAPFEVELEDGTTLYTRGYVDRVDTYKNGNDVYVRVVDYKTGKKTFSISDVEKGLNLQMYLYLFAVWNTKDKWFLDKIQCKGNIIPAGMFYYLAHTPSVEVKNDQGFASVYSDAAKSIARSGLVLNDENIINAMDKDRSGRNVPITRTPTGKIRSNQSLKSLADFGELQTKIEGILKSIGKNMKDGVVKTSPFNASASDMPCSYCKMKPICRRIRKEDADE